jgi:hypothetical protein
MSARRKLLTLITIALAIKRVAALNVSDSSGDEFSNNLFSDLAPILALFGEQVYCYPLDLMTFRLLIERA